MSPIRRLLNVSLAALACALLSAPALYAAPERESAPESTAQTDPSKLSSPPKPAESTQPANPPKRSSAHVDSGKSPEPTLDSPADYPAPEKSTKSQPPQNAKSTSTKPSAPSASRIFVGVGGGVLLQDRISLDSPAFKHLHPALSITLRGGYEYEFFGAMPLRLYLDYTLGVAPVGIESLITSNFLLNADASYYHRVLENLRLGAFAGLGLGYGTYGKEVKEDPSASDSVLAKGFVMFVNAGLGAEIDQAHRLEALLKLPVVRLNLSSALSYQELHVLFVYSYLF